MTSTREDKAEIYRDAGRKWRYRIVAGNGKIVDASQGYMTKWNAKRAARRNRPGINITVLKTIRGK